MLFFQTTKINLEAISMCLLYGHVAVLHDADSSSHINFHCYGVSFSTFRDKICIFHRYEGILVTTFLQATKYSTPMAKHVS
jgi:hypothetical protein